LIRTRFAPSPTGYLHLGGVRTALYNWLYACQHQGKFILRIEDTDVKRSTQKSLHNILASLKWLGLEWDEGPYFQSQRIKIYQEYAQKLIKADKAYYCYCPAKDKERIKEDFSREGDVSKYRCHCKDLATSKIKEYEASIKPKVVRFKVLEGVTEFFDLVRDKISFSNETISDFVIMKSDGNPTYNFSVVVDDALMEITHVIRGDDHISNTPRQIMLFKALDFKLPKFVHLSMILGLDKKRLSKRHGATSLTYFKKEGYLPEALINYLSLLGWSTVDSQQIFSKEELLKKFSLKGLSKNPAIFDYEKMLWMNGEYLRKLRVEELTKNLIGFLKKTKNYVFSRDNWYQEVALLYQTRVKTINEIFSQADYLFKEDIEIEEEAAQMYLDREEVIKILMKVREAISQISNFNQKNVEEAIKELMIGLQIGAKEIIHPLRVALTGKTASPGIFEVIYLLGQEMVLKRIDRALCLIKTGE